MILVLAATGARFSQIQRLRVADVQVARSRIILPPSHKGVGGTKISTPFPLASSDMAALLPVIEGRGGNEVLLHRWRKKQVVGAVRWERDSRGAWNAASELSRPWKLIRNMALTPNADVYALRHSSIVRFIRQRMPTHLVAALHDTSVAMIERHYGRYITHGLDDLAAQAVVPLLSADHS